MARIHFDVRHIGQVNWYIVFAGTCFWIEGIVGTLLTDKHCVPLRTSMNKFDTRQVCAQRDRWFIYMFTIFCICLAFRTRSYAQKERSWHNRGSILSELSVSVWRVVVWCIGSSISMNVSAGSLEKTFCVMVVWGRFVFQCAAFITPLAQRANMISLNHDPKVRPAVLIALQTKGFIPKS